MCVCVCVYGKRERKREAETEIILPIAVSLPKYPQLAELGQAGAKSLKLHLVTVLVVKTQAGTLTGTWIRS